MKNSRIDIQKSVLQYSLSEHHPRFLTIITINMVYNKSYSDIMGTNNITHTTQTDMNYLSHLYNTLFENSKLNKACILQIPVLKNSDPKDLEHFFKQVEISRYKTEYHMHLYMPNFILLPLLSDGKNYSEVALKLPSRPTSSLVLLVKINTNELLFPCTPTLKDCWIDYKLRWILADKQTKQILGNGNIWSDLNGRSQNFQNFKGLSQFSEYACTQTEINLSYQNYFSFLDDQNDCLKLIIAASINCTSIECVYTMLSYEFSFLRLIEEYHVDPIRIQMVSPFGALFHGYRYSVFVNKMYNKLTSEDSNVFRLLAPIDTIGWLTLVVTIIYLGYILNITRHQDNSYYWIFAVTIEQADDLRKSVNFKNWFLIFLWLYASHLIRSLYTSDMYTYMTMDSDPTNIPETFNELVLNNSMNILVDLRIYQKLKNGKFTNNYDTAFQQYLLNKMEEKSWVYFDSEENAVNLAYSGRKYQERILCHFYEEHDIEDGIFLVGWDNQRKLHKRLENVIFRRKVVPNCTTWNRFAWFYATHSSRIHKSSLYTKLLLMLFGEYFLMENNDQIVFSELHFWYSPKNNLLQDLFFSRLASLDASGIYAYHNHIHEFLTQMKVLDFFRLNVKLNFSLSWFSLVNILIPANSRLGWYSATSYKLAESLSKTYEIDSRTGTFKDFNYVWILYGVFIMPIILLFIFEMSFFSVYRWFLCVCTRVYLAIQDMMYLKLYKCWFVVEAKLGWHEQQAN